MSLLSFLPPAVRVYSLAWSSAWKLTGAQKVVQFYIFLSLFFPLSASLSLLSLLSDFVLSLLIFLLFSHPSPCPLQPQLFFLSDYLTFCPSSCGLLLSLHLFVYISPRLPSFFCFFHVSLDAGRLQPYSNTSQSLLPDEAAYSNHCLVSVGPPLQLHKLRSNGVVEQNKLKNLHDLD